MSFEEKGLQIPLVWNAFKEQGGWNLWSGWGFGQLLVSLTSFENRVLLPNASVVLLAMIISFTVMACLCVAVYFVLPLARGVMTFRIPLPIIGSASYFEVDVCFNLIQILPETPFCQTKIFLSMTLLLIAYKWLCSSTVLARLLTRCLQVCPYSEEFMQILS